MQIFEFGNIIATKVELRDDDTIFVTNAISGEFSVDIQDIQRLYIKKPSFGEKGFIYISLDDDIIDSPITDKQTIEYNKQHVNDIETFVTVLSNMNESLKVIYVTRSTKMQKDPAVIENRAPLKCPSCKSVNVQYMGNQRKSFSVGKAVAGGLLTGGVGAVAGFAGKKGQDRWHCAQCGNVFDTPPR